MAGYDSRQVDGATEFTTVPEVVPMPYVLVAIPGVLLILIALSMKFIYGVIAAALVYGAMYLLTHSKQATQYRTPAKFRVSPTGIDVGGATIAKDAIHRVMIRNHILKSAEGIIVVANPNQNSGQQNTVAGMNWAISKLGPISYRVDVEAKGVPTTLAGGLSEPVASAIASDVSKIMQLP